MEAISNDEIKYAEKLLLPEGESFNEERRKILTDLTSINVQACPGSGKTTVLLAKLLILANRMPFEDKRGICILTHTNVGIDEIKERLENRTSVLFQYPNFFGTFQSFVDKFLAIPAAIHYLDTRPDRISGEVFDKKSEWKYNQLSWDHPLKLKNWLYGSASRGQNGLTTAEKDNNARKLFRNIKVDYVNGKILPEMNGKRSLLTLSSNSAAAKEKCKAIIALKNSIIKEDEILGYDEAYLFALKYLNDYEELLKGAFQKRFSYVFIDEMQDTDIHQNQIIDTLFDSIDVVMQKIGDTNQAIFGRVKSDKLWEPDSLPINDSKRFHNAIAEKVKTICVEENNPIMGNNSANLAITPTILVFDNPLQVLPKYAELIIQNNLHVTQVREGRENIYKAIGWVKNNKKGELSISSYWKEYVIDQQSKKDEFNNLLEHLQIDSSQTKKGFKFFKDRILAVLLKALSITENRIERNGTQRSFNKTSLINTLKNLTPNVYEQFSIGLSNWLLKIVRGEDVSEEIALHIKNLIISHFTLKNEAELDKFLNSKNPQSTVTVDNGSVGQTPNRFIYEKSGNQSLNIDVGTIHSAKGETHTATLYLETYYYKGHESERLMNFLKGNYNKTEASKTRHIESLKMAYVGMTRPSHFLCVAIHKDRITGHEGELQDSGWLINQELLIN